MATAKFLRSGSEGTVFSNSWHYVSSGRKTLAEELTSTGPAPPSIRLKVPKGDTSSAPNSPQSKLDSSDDHTTIGPINPRKQKKKANEIVYRTNLENRRIIESATLDQLIKAFAEDTQDNFAIQRLILVHEQFIDSLEFFNRFVAYFENAKDSQITQFRVTNIVKKWIEVAYISFERNPKLMEALKKFMGQLQGVNPQLLAFLNKAILTTNEEVSTDGEDYVEPPSPIKPKKKKPKDGWELTDFHPKEIARQLALIDWELSSKIPLHEMLKSRWIKNQAPNLEEASQRVNSMAYWFAWNILNCSTMKKRVEMIVHVIKIAKHLIIVGDFNALMALYLSVNFASVARMTQTWKGVSAKHFQIYQRLCSLMSPRTNFHNYRQFVAEKKLPMVLCQEVFLKDLLYQEDGKDNYVSNGVLDMAKMDQIAQTIENLRASQQKKFPFVKVDVIYSHLASIPSNITVEVLDNLSQIAEPGSINFNTGSATDTLSKRSPSGGIAKLEEEAQQLSNPSKNKSNPSPSDVRVHSTPTPSTTITSLQEREKAAHRDSEPKPSKRNHAASAAPPH